MSIIIFLILLFLSVLVIRPAYTELLSHVSEYTRDIISKVEDATSLKLSYKSLSPSILSAFYIKDIELTDENGEVVAKIDKVKLEYRLLNLIRARLDNTFRVLVADGVEINVDAAIPILQRFIKGDAEKSGFNFSSFKANLPLDFVVKNVSLIYTKNNFTANVNLKKITAEYVQRKKELDVSLSSFVEIRLNKNRYSCNLGVNGSLFDGFENSTAKLTVANLTDGSLKFNKLNLFLNFKEDILTWATIQNSFPLSFTAIYDTVQKYADVTLVANDFSVDSIFSSTGRNVNIKKLKDFKFTSDSHVTYVFNDNSISYWTNTSLKLPEAILPGSGILKLSARGDEKEIDIKELSLKGENYDVTSNLDFIYKNLSLSGFVEVPKIELSNGTVISTEMYIDPLDEGFMAFVPQVFIGEKSFTALQFLVLPNEDSIDFSFEGYDYSHFESNEPGTVLVDGSYLISSNYVQTSLSVNSFYLDSVVDTVATLLKNDSQNMVSALSDSVSDFMFSGDAYFSTDFSSLSFNVPYILLANTKKDNQFLMLSVDGNEQSISLNQSDLIFGKLAFHATAGIEKVPNSNDLFFTADLNADSIPYHFVGTYTDGLIKVSGDYDTEFEVGFDADSTASGYFQFANFPISFFGSSLVSSMDAGFYYSLESGPEINLRKFEMEFVGNRTSSNPHIAISGNATKYGAQFDSISYTDLYSMLDGSADIVINLFDGIFNSGSLSLKLENQLSDESILVDANVTNPEQMPFDLESLKKNFYFDSSIIVNRFSLNRFTRMNSANNEATASVVFTGTIEHPYVSVGLDKASVMISGNALTASASILMEDKDISINEVDVKYRGIKVNNVAGMFSLDSFTGDLNANIDGIIMKESIHIPLTLSLADSVKDGDSIIPKSFVATLSSDGVYGSFMKKNVGFSLSAFVSPSMISIVSSDNIGLIGNYNAPGEFFFQVNTEDIAHLKINGTIDTKTLKMNGKLSDAFVQMDKLCSYFNFHNFINVYSGDLKGSLTFGGTLDSPEFIGAMSVENPNITLPTVIPDHIFSEKILLTFYNGEIDIPDRIVKIKKNSEVLANCKIFLDKWKLEHIEADIKTEKNKSIPVNLKTSGFSVSGEADGKISLYYVPHDLEVSGSIFAEKAEVYLNLTKLFSSEESQETPNTYVRCNLDASLGTHVRLNVNPLIRCVFVPNASLNVQYDQRTEQIELEGILGLKSGDVSYLNRNFYIKEGTIKFARTDEQINPRITVRAETRERDSNGDNVTIILNALNQQLMSFTPTFSSVPAKSENEIRALLGQIAVADSDNVGNFLFAAGDYAIQSMIGRKVENSLRDFLNFDILSVRTNIIQNALSYSSNRNNATSSFNGGNFLDNSTVYIGKYLGSSLYVDAMVHLQYDEKNVSESSEWITGYSFHPEFGFEFASPFANAFWNDDVIWNFNFRLNIAPDINAMIYNQQFVPETSLSLSWKFSF